MSLRHWQVYTEIVTRKLLIKKRISCFEHGSLNNNQTGDCLITCILYHIGGDRDVYFSLFGNDIILLDTLKKYIRMYIRTQFSTNWVGDVLIDIEFLSDTCIIKNEYIYCLQKSNLKDMFGGKL